MRRGPAIGLAAVGVAVIGAALWFAVLRQPAPEAGPDTAATPATPGLASSAGKVEVSAAWATGPGEDDHPRIELALHIADGWHVNANPASLDFLIPTRVQATVDGGAAAVSPAYPSGRESDIQLEGTRIRVYGDGTIIPVELPAATLQRVRGAGALELAVRVQSCSDSGTCLAPATVRTTLPAGDAGAS